MLTRYIAPPPVFAQAFQSEKPGPPEQVAQGPITNELRARSFVLVDQFNNAVGTFTSEPIGVGTNRTSRIVLLDSRGQQIWSAGGSTIRPLAATVR